MPSSPLFTLKEGLMNFHHKSSACQVPKQLPWPLLTVAQTEEKNQWQRAPCSSKPWSVLFPAVHAAATSEEIEKENNQKKLEVTMRYHLIYSKATQECWAFCQWPHKEGLSTRKALSVRSRNQGKSLGRKMKNLTGRLLWVMVSGGRWNVHAWSGDFGRQQLGHKVNCQEKKETEGAPDERGLVHNGSDRALSPPSLQLKGGHSPMWKCFCISGHQAPSSKQRGCPSELVIQETQTPCHSLMIKTI